MMDLTFMTKEGLKKALGDLRSYEILEKLTLPEDYEILDLGKLEAAVKAKRESR